MKAVLNPNTNEVLGFDDNMSDDQISSAIQSDKDGRPLVDVNPTPYDVMVRPALEKAKLTGNNDILYDAQRRAQAADPFQRSVLHGLTFGLTPDLNPEEKKAYGTEDVLGNLAGQTGAILATAGLGEVLGVGKLAATASNAARAALPAEAAATTVGSGAILPVTAGELAANTAASVTSSAALGAMYNGITESVNQGKIFAQDHTSPDVAKIGESILKGAVSWAPYGVGGAFIPKTMPGLATGTAAVAGTAYVVSKADGASEPDAKLNAILMGIFHFVSHATGTRQQTTVNDKEPLPDQPKDNIVRDDKGEPITLGMDQATREGIVTDLQNTFANYTKAKNGMTEAANLHQMVGDELVKEEARAAIDKSNSELAAKPPATEIPTEPPLRGIGATLIRSANIQAEIKANQAKEAGQVSIPEQFRDPYAPEMLDYLAQYIAPKEVARMSGEQRLALANAPWQELREVSEKFDRGEIGELKDFFAAKIKKDANLARSQDNTFKEVTSSDTLTKALTDNVTKKVIAAQEPMGTTDRGILPQKIRKSNTALTETEDLANLKAGESQNGPEGDKEASIGLQRKTDNQSSTVKSASTAENQSSDNAVESSKLENQTNGKSAKAENVDKADFSSLNKTITPKEENINSDNSPKAESGLAKSVESSAIEKGLTEDLGDLPTYAKRNMKEIAKQVEDFINKDPELAKKIALGEAPEQDGLRSQELFTGLRVKAEKEGDIETLRQLALSDKAAALATELGQRVKALDTGDAESPVKAMKAVKEARTAEIKKKGVKDVAKEAAKTVDEIKESIKKNVPRLKDWNEFLEAIRC